MQMINRKKMKALRFLFIMREQTIKNQASQIFFRNHQIKTSVFDVFKPSEIIEAGSSRPCLTNVKSDNLVSFSPLKKCSWNFRSNWFQFNIEFGASKENQEKAVPVNDKENKRTRKASLKLASPNCNIYWPTCSQVVRESSPLNLMNSRTRQPTG